ncbi:MAG: peptide chain release factor N(5)-glutamine methyltransferase [Acidobacteria bacterium]|jgi:release factor glutamine methyltransferase|nr:peptide chain release factor N(5)-glutamine methyltransferase [Acidobacteriota bacterium]
MVISEILKNAAGILQQSGVAEPRRESVLLLAFALQKNKTFLIAHPENKLSAEEEKRFQEFLQRRANREPFQYITGKQEFYGLDFAVTKDVLIPRSETELIVENAIEILRGKENPTFCEIGIGSGCISVSILHEVKTASAIGLDISENTLEIARENSVTHNVLNRLDLKISDVFEVLKNEKFDLIVSNPPYIASENIETLQVEVRCFEPLTALTDGKDGLSIIKKIINDAPKFLKPHGFLLIEIGFNQADKVKSFFSSNVWQKIEILPDLQGIPRIVKAKIR